MNVIRTRYVLILLSTLFLIFCIGCKKKAPVPGRSLHTAEQGVLRLTDTAFSQRQAVYLQGEWEWYWKQFIEPAAGDTGDRTGYFDFPGLWNGRIVNGKKLSGDGYASFRLVVTGLEAGETYGIKLKEMDTAYELWVNGEKTAVCGSIGRDKASSVPSWRRHYAYFAADTEKAEIILRMSNFHHRKGGPEEAILFGTAEAIASYVHSRILWEAFLGGGIGLIGLYHLILFLFRRKDKSPLLLALFCIGIVFRILFTGEKLFLSLFPDIGWTLLLKLEYLDLFILAPLIGAFYYLVYPRNIPRVSIRILHSISTLFIIFTIFAPAVLFTYLAPVYQGVFFLFGLFVLYVMVRLVVKKTGGAALLLIGTILLLISGINDILYNNLLITSLPLSPLGLPIGLFFFILAHAAFLARRFTSAFITAEELSKTLENKVEERTAELFQEKEKLVQYAREDMLTGLYNRRYVFELLEKDYFRFRRYGTIFSIIIFDLDLFKQINDNYGHLSGDMVLRAFGKTLRQLTREIDITARFGGEEFLVLLPETTGKAALKVAEKVRETFESLSFSGGEESFNCTCSAGIAEMNESCNSINDLIKQADIVLYRAKEGGRNRVLTARWAG